MTICAWPKELGEDNFVNSSVIYALWARQIKRYYRSKSRIIGSLGQPLLLLVALGFGFGPIFQAAGQQVDYLDFLLPGIIAMGIMFLGMFSGVEIIWDRQFGFLKEIMVAPISRAEIMIGRTLGGASSAFIQGVLVLLIALPFGVNFNHTASPILVPFFMIVIAISFTALGTAVAAKLENMQGFQLVMSLLMMPLFFLSGALFPLENLPAALKLVVSLNPLSYGVDGLRFAFLGMGHFSLATDILISAGFAVLMLLVGSWLFSKIEL